MVNEIRFTKLGDIAQIKGGKRLPNGSSLQQAANSHPYIRVRDLNNVIILEKTTDFEYVDDETQKQISRYTVDEGDIVLSIVGTIGLLAIVGKSLHKANLTENCVRITNIDKNYNKLFLFYFLHSQYGQNEIKRGIVGAVQAKLPLKNIATISVPVLPLIIQHKIGIILSSIDDKIRLNTKINRNLEQQAQAIFKSWFVDFEPFRDGKFVDSELGLIPEGWALGTLKDMLEIRYGKDHKKLSNGTIPVYGSGGIMRFADTALYSGESVLIPRKGTLNNVLRVTGDFWTVDTMFYSIPKRKGAVKFSFHILSNMDLASMNSGSAVPSMTTDILNSINIILPPQHILDTFETTTDALWRLYESNSQESNRLATLRDMLLPKLMSGEIDVSEVEV